MDFSKLLSKKKKDKKRKITVTDTSNDNKRQNRADNGELKVYFVHVPKTAGSAIKHVFTQTEKPGQDPKEEWHLPTKNGGTVHIIANGHTPASRFPSGAFQLS